ncbi:unnamed protein product [Paramecium sonneborni]|uniref:Triacylglycerol lipase N-terminal domain-containing protein n=1 Tax=Paramecium sonneborni TaxID=65129 RepID=A0A8S1LW97_9CILI|nr:unnamed protein product [Paramecium sonneborni]
MFEKKNHQRYKYLNSIEIEKIYEKWLELANKHDLEDYIQKWLQKEEISIFQYKYIKNLNQKLKQAQEEINISLICRLLRKNANRNKGNILNPKLYSYAFTKSKNLIEEFQEEYQKCLQFQYNSEFPQQNLIFQRSSKNCRINSYIIFRWCNNGIIYLLSSQYFGQIRDFTQSYDWQFSRCDISQFGWNSYRCTNYFQPKYYDYSMFEQKSQFDILDKIGRLLTKGYIQEKEQMQQFLQKAYGDITFLEAYQKTGKIMNFMVTGKE